MEAEKGRNGEEREGLDFATPPFHNYSMGAHVSIGYKRINNMTRQTDARRHAWHRPRFYT